MKNPSELISSFLFPPPGLTPLAPVASHRFPGIVPKLQRFPGQAFISQTRKPSPEKWSHSRKSHTSWEAELGVPTGVPCWLSSEHPVLGWLFHPEAGGGKSSFTPAGIDSLRMACVLFSSLATGQLSVSPQVSSQHTRKPMSFLQDNLVHFSANNPCWLRQAGRKAKPVKELEHLLAEVLWDPSHCAHLYPLLCASWVCERGNWGGNGEHTTATPGPAWPGWGFPHLPSLS